MMLVLLALVGSTLAARAAGDTSAPVVLERKISLKSVGGRIDHMAIDLKRKRLFVAELGNGTLEASTLRRERWSGASKI
jgi:hypothetical protein